MVLGSSVWQPMVKTETPNTGEHSAEPHCMKQAVTSCLSAFGMQRKRLWMKYKEQADFKCTTNPCWTPCLRCSILRRLANWMVMRRRSSDQSSSGASWSTKEIQRIANGHLESLLFAAAWP